MLQKFEAFITKKTKRKKNMKLSDQALGALMMALQKSLIEQTDIVPVLKNFDFVTSENDEEELLVSNPPTFKIEEESEFVYD